MISVIGGLEAHRDAAARAAGVLGHQVKRSEDFAASASSPQGACLLGVRWAEVVILLLGARYGEPQTSGLSPTHEEYREAKDRCPVLAFSQTGVDPEPDQRRFLDEVGAWAGGVLTGSFSSPEQLGEEVTRALHELELSGRAGTPDEAEMAARAEALLPATQHGRRPALCLAVAGGPPQQVLRPAELEEAGLRADLHQQALFGPHAVFDPAHGVTYRVDEPALVLEQPEASLLVDQLGSVPVVQPARELDPHGLPVILEEEVEERLLRALGLIGAVLDRIDPVRRLAHVVPVVAVVGGAYVGWRTREEHSRSPQSVQMHSGMGDSVVRRLAPAVVPRPALTHQAPRLAQDFVVLLRRVYRR